MLIGIVDDGIGLYPTLCKLRQAVSAEFVCVVCDKELPLGDKSAARLRYIGGQALALLADLHCDAAVFSSVSLSTARSSKTPAPMPLFGCDAPLLHASAYTASQVLAVGDAFALRSRNFDGLAVCMPRFPLLAETGNERQIVQYISDCCDAYSGQFDCIALANSSMNLYKHCFKRVFPNVKIFDSLEGVARRLRKQYKKQPKEDAVCRLVDLDGRPLQEKYTFFTE